MLTTALAAGDNPPPAATAAPAAAAPAVTAPVVTAPGAPMVSSAHPPAVVSTGSSCSGCGQGWSGGCGSCCDTCDSGCGKGGFFSRCRGMFSRKHDCCDTCAPVCETHHTQACCPAPAPCCDTCNTCCAKEGF